MKRIVLDTKPYNAKHIVSDDKHFKPLRNIDFPKLVVLKLMEFVEKLNIS